MLARSLGQRPERIPQAFTMYKEVLDYYNRGLQVPDDVTLVWPEDNYGYLNQLGTARERSGSNPPDSRQSPFGAYASPPPSSFGQQGFGEPRRRRGAETPLGNGLASPRHVPRATRSPGPPTATSGRWPRSAPSRTCVS